MNVKKKILIVFSAAPYPLRENGTAIRYLPFIKKLHKFYELDIVIIDDINEDSISGLSEYCNNYYVVKRPKKSKYWVLESMLMMFSWAFPWTLPYSFRYYSSGQTINSIVNRVSNQYHLLIWVTSTHLPMMPSLKHRLGAHKVLIDFIDSPYLIMKREMKRAGLTGALRRYELWKTKKWERSIVQQSNDVVYISPVDANAAGECDAISQVHVIPNGVDIGEHTDEAGVNFGGKTIGYLGNMGYGPNVDAVLWLYMKLLNRRVIGNDIKLIVIGKEADDRILHLANDPRVIITGMVDNIWPYINSVDIFVLPIFTGAGLKNKVLEIMYARKPLITTCIGNEGIDAENGKHLFICESEEEFAGRINQLFEDEDLRNRIGQESREFVNENFNSEAVVRQYMNLIESYLS